MTSLLLFIGGTVFGWLSLIGLGAYRAVNSVGWDDSNITNWLRLFAHVVIHPEDFALLWYVEEIDGQLVASRRPFWYVSEDELSVVVDTRPREYEQNRRLP